MRTRLLAFVAAALAAVITGCSGGGGASAGIDRLGISSGTVTGFGSVIVNGVRYEVGTTTEVSFNDASGTQADLQVGQQVTVRWESGDGGTTRRATRIDYDAAVEGPITAGSIDLAAGTFVVLGQTVRVTANTSFSGDISPRDLTGLAAGEPVEVSGLPDAAGRLRATRIERQRPGRQLEVRGVAATVTAQTFALGALTVVYTGAALPDGVPVNGDFVEARGSTIDGLGRLVATEVEREDDFADLGGSRDDSELEGFITVFNSPTDFTVAGVRVTTTPATVYEDGSVADLRLNARIEVSGSVNSSGVLVAREVEFESFDDDDDGDDDALDGRVEANVASVNVAAGTLVAAGVTIQVTPATRVEDQRSGVRPFTLASLAVGDFIEARGTPGSGAQLTALLLERDDASSTGRLRGPAGAIVPPALSVLGVPVQTTGATVFRDDDGALIDSAAFFGAVAAGSEVQVRFVQGGSPIVATEIQLEDDADDDGSGDDD
ncbi:MAG: hypothetical protein JNM50_08770 [Chromatiales bacterium]|jgi:hypothetical protein|nr:hypothetical protein [Chromatiales bacterium]